MPKGDKLKLKADPEDGTTPIANLLLEAAAMAKLSGLQKGAILYLWRRTYGWIVNGHRLKERKITLTEWKNALNSSASRLSKALSELEAHNIIHRRMADAWGGYYYQINTNIFNWNRDCINLAKLAEQIGIDDFATIDQNATIDQSDNCFQKSNATVDQNATPPCLEGLTKTQLPTLYKESIKESIKKEGDVKNTSPSFGDKTKEVFARIDKLRGYRPPKRKAEAASIIRMLKKDLTPDQIIDTWQRLKKDKFWQDKELFMMTVESQIGAILSKGANQPASESGKYGHMVK